MHQHSVSFVFAAIILSCCLGLVSAQETSLDVPPTPAQDVDVAPVPAPAREADDNASGLAETVKKNTEEIAREIDNNPDAREISAGILQPIYKLAEYMAMSWFNWVAFMLMITGVVSFALQLVLGKLVVLLRAGFDFKEILLDAQSLLISLVGLVLTTQAAAENSTFMQSPAAVLSSAALGIILGFLFYLWGQSTEIQALKGRRLEQIADRRD